MRAVNLVPRDARRSAGGFSVGQIGPGGALLGALAVVLALVVVYVLSANQVTSRKSELASLHAQITQVKAQSAEVSSYTSFQKLAEARMSTVQQISAGRFDWHSALSDLSRVIPANASLQSLNATISPTAGTSTSSSGGAAGAASTGTLRSAIDAPAFEISGCTQTQDDVARLISRLRLINGVQRVTLAGSTKPSEGGGGGSAPAGTGASATGGAAGATGCGPNAPSFGLVIFFQALPNSTASGSGSTSQPVSTTSSGSGK